MSFKICANLSFMFQENTSLLERYSLAHQCGFSAVECAFPYDYTESEVKNARETSKVEQVMINAYPGDVSNGELGFAALPGKEEAFMNSVLKAVSYAKALNCFKIHIMSGIVQSPNTLHDDVYKSNLQSAVDLFEKEKIVGLLEPINPYSVPNYYMNSFDKAVSIINEINSPNLKLQLDIYHLQLLKGNLTNNLKALLPYTGHIQIAQVPHRNEPDTAGEINYRYVFQLLREMQYCEWIGLEYKPASSTEVGLKWMEMVK